MLDIYVFGRKPNRSCSIISAPVLFTALILFLGSLSGFCEAVPQASFETVPRPSWTYDALGWLAKRGKTSPYSARDFLYSRIYTRVEIADIIRDLNVTNGHCWDYYTPEELTVLSQLIDEYRVELEYLEANAEELASGMDLAKKHLLMKSAGVYADWRNSSGHGAIRGMTSLTAISFHGEKTLFGATASTERRLFQPDSYHAFPVLDRFYYRARLKGWKIEAGRGYSWVGTAGSGSLWLGDPSPPMYQAKAEKVFHLGSILGQWRFTWQVSGFRENKQNLYVINKMIEKTLSYQWSVSFIDMVKTSDTPNPAMLVLPGPMYQAMFLTDVDAKWNGMLGFQAVWRPNKNMDTYGQVMVDDMRNPFGGHPAPRKMGFLLGIRSREGEPMDAGVRFRLEYADIDARAYEATRPSSPLLSWTQKGLPLAWPYGANSRTFVARSERKLTPTVDLTSSFVYRKHKDGGGKTRIISIQPSKDFGADKSVGLLFEKHWDDLKQTVIGVRMSMTF